MVVNGGRLQIAAAQPRLIQGMRLSPRLALLVLLPLVAAGQACQQHEFRAQSNVVVLNESACTLIISVDGWDATSIDSSQIRTVDNVGSGRHVLEAKDDLGRLIERRYVELSKGEDFHWRLQSCPSH